MKYCMVVHKGRVQLGDLIATNVLGRELERKIFSQINLYFPY